VTAAVSYKPVDSAAAASRGSASNRFGALSREASGSSALGSAQRERDVRLAAATAGVACVAARPFKKGRKDSGFAGSPSKAGSQPGQREAMQAGRVCHVAGAAVQEEQCAAAAAPDRCRQREPDIYVWHRGCTRLCCLGAAMNTSLQETD